MYKVLCPGEALIDWVAKEAKPLSSCNVFLKKAGGAPLNAAGAMRKFDVESFFMGAVGSDPFGDFLLSTMDQFQINKQYVEQCDYFTTSAYVSLDEFGERDFIFNRGADQHLKLSANFDIANFDCIHFSSATAFLGGDLEQSYYQLLDLAIDNNLVISFDPNYRSVLFEDNHDEFIKKSLEFIKKSHIVKLSEEEALLLSGASNYQDAGEQLSKLGCKYLLITLGSKGTCLFTENNSYHVDSVSVKPIDTTGAGDAFIGSLVAMFLTKKPSNDLEMVEIVKQANKVGAITTLNFGGFDSIPTFDELSKYMNN